MKNQIANAYHIPRTKLFLDSNQSYSIKQEQLMKKYLVILAIGTSSLHAQETTNLQKTGDSKKENQATVIVHPQKLDPTNWDSLPKALQENLTKVYDLNKNGKLDQEEQIIALKQLQISMEKSKERKKAVLQKYDTNNNGILDPEEKKVAHEDFLATQQAHQSPTPPQTQKPSQE